MYLVDVVLALPSLHPSTVLEKLFIIMNCCQFICAFFVLSCITTLFVGRCSKPENPANGQVTVTSSSYAAYACESGYQLVGEQTRTCQNNGQWSGQAPTCVTVGM